MKETLHFENARHVQALLGNDEKNLDALRERFAVEITARDGWIQIEGEAEGVQRAKEFVETLDTMVQRGQTIRAREFGKALEVMSEEGVEALRGLMAERVLTSPRKAAIVPKTTGQRRYLEAIRTHDITLGIGPAGTGKTYLAMAMAAAALRDEKVARIILTRPAVEAGEALGFLPGDLQEKLSPYLRPLHDALMDMIPAEEVQKLMERGTIEIAPLAYMRGRTLNHAFIVLDEAQNTTPEQMFMFLTRLGNGSKAVVTGDPSQVDLPRHKQSGIIEARQALAAVPGIAIIEFTRRDVVRHPLVQRIINAYETHRGITSP